MFLQRFKDVRFLKKARCGGQASESRTGTNVFGVRCRQNSTRTSVSGRLETLAGGLEIRSIQGI
jgi:hypothetical protein